MARAKVYSVHITGLVEGGQFSEADQSESNDDWREKLGNARANKVAAYVNCLCKGRDDDRSLRRLVVRYRQDYDRFYISAWQYTGGEHRHDCRFYSVWADKSSAKAYAAKVVTVNDDGTISITLPIGLSRKDSSESPENVIDPATHPRTGHPKPSMSLLGLLQFLWHNAQINTWKPQYVKNKPRNALWLAARINRAAENICISGLRLSDVLLVSAAKKGKQASANQARVRFAKKQNKRMIAIALLKTDFKNGYPELQNGILRLSSPMGFPTLNVSPNVLSACERSFKTELKAWRKGRKVVAVVETEPPTLRFEKKDDRTIPINEAEVIGIALMVVTPRFIPVDSGYEADVEARLCQEERSFLKPLRLDAEDDTLPDFVLTDLQGQRPMPMEVFGMKTAEYLARKQTKIAFYDSKYGREGWWFWDAAFDTTGKNIPSFPKQSDN